MASQDSTSVHAQIADALARAYDGQPLVDLRDEHAEHHLEGATAVLETLGDIEVAVYRIALLPIGHPMREFAAISVRRCDSGRWQADRLGFILGADGLWEQGTKQTPEWRAKHEFDLPTALDLARKAAPGIRVGDTTVGELLEAAPDSDGALFTL